MKRQIGLFVCRPVEPYRSYAFNIDGGPRRFNVILDVLSLRHILLKVWWVS